MSLERMRNPRKPKHVYGTMEADYLYTLGVAGERFFKAIKDNSVIMGAKCDKCGVVYLPPRLYCEVCFSELKEWVDVGKRGYVYTYTIAYVDHDGKPLDKPIIYALIRINGTVGGILHKLGEVDPEKVYIGMEVEAVLKPPEQRTGSINDILYFRPV